MEKPFVIYRSSAGSGKTYTLALEYLKLALLSPNAFRNILAVTFTNKATREMKGRIVQFLYDLKNGNNDALKKQLIAATGLNDSLLRERSGEVLSNILHAYSYFSVMTIDSFFQKVIRAFAREMGLQAGFAIELDQEKVLDEVIDSLLSELGEPQHQLLQEWLVRFSEEKVESGKVWDFRRDIKQLARELFKEEYKLMQEEEIDRGEDMDNRHYQNVLSQLKAIVKTFENSMQSYGKEGLHMMASHGLEYTDFAYGKSGVGNYFVRLAEKSDFDPKKRSREAAEDTEKWSTKSSKKKEVILEVVSLGLQNILIKAVSQYDREHILYQSALQLLKFIYAYGILRDVGKKLEDYKRENDLMLISDASVFLRDIIGKDETPFIYEKIGSNFQHFLIDEFQDTSGMQWNNFRPLIENSLDSGFKNLVVGDVKQSIYRWRGGDWQLLLEKIQEDIAPWNTSTFNLDTNFRSSKNIVDFNNWLFSNLPTMISDEISSKFEHLEESERQLLASRAEIIAQAYEDVHQKLPGFKQDPDTSHGYIQIEMLEKNLQSDEEDEESVHWKEQVKRKLPALVESLQDQGYALKEIAFLVRDKKAGKEVVDTMMAYKAEGHAKAAYSYEIISSESLFLNASITVSLLIDLLRILNRQDDVIAKGSAVFKYHKLHHKAIDSDELHRIFMSTALTGEQEDSSAFFQYLPDAFKVSYEELTKLPLYELVENLISIFELNQADELAYLQTFQDAVLTYSGQEAGDLYSFLKWWGEQGQETSVRISEDVDAMRILTIHKSKGLQFKVVIIPYCDWELDHRSGQDNIIWTQSTQAPFDQFGLMPMRYGTKLSSTYFRMDYYHEMIKAYIDNLNLLYVAFTRAEEALYAYSAPAINKSAPVAINSVANALYHVCASSEVNDTFKAAWDEENRIFSLGKIAEKLPPKASGMEKLGLQRYASESWRDRLTVRPQAKDFFTFDEQGEMIINRSIIYRDVLANMYDANELEQVLEKVSFERGIGLHDKIEMLQSLQQMLSEEPLKSWFTETYDSVRLKVTLSTPQGNLFQPDRLMFYQDQAYVIHFHQDKQDKETYEILKGAIHVIKSTNLQVNAYLYDTQHQQALTLSAIESAILRSGSDQS